MERKLSPTRQLLVIGVMCVTALAATIPLINGITKLRSPALLGTARSLVGQPEGVIQPTLGSPRRVLTREQVLRQPTLLPEQGYAGDLSVPEGKIYEYEVPLGRVYLYISPTGIVTQVRTAWT
jgi:hypothetical protein